MSVVEVSRGSSPLVLAIPHSGTSLPAALRRRLNERGAMLADTDWYVDRLYDGLLADASVVKATFHRYVIDANRDPDPAADSLYPGMTTTALCPTTDFEGETIWIDGAAPDASEIRERVRDFHAPYHAALQKVLETTHSRLGVALLFDCHSIRSRLPFLFDGALPGLNIGSNDGASCAPAIENAAAAVARGSGLSSVVNGRFKGGWTTRHYGRPESGVHAIQLEIAQSTYMQESPPWNWLAERAETLRAVLGDMLRCIESLARVAATDAGWKGVNEHD